MHKQGKLLLPRSGSANSRIGGVGASLARRRTLQEMDARMRRGLGGRVRYAWKKISARVSRAGTRGS